MHVYRLPPGYVIRAVSLCILSIPLRAAEFQGSLTFRRFTASGDQGRDELIDLKSALLSHSSLKFPLDSFKYHGTIFLLQSYQKHEILVPSV